MSTCSKGAVYLVWLAAIISVFLLLSAPLPTFAADDIVSVAVLDFQVGNIPYWWNWRLEKEITEMVTDGLTGKGEYRLLERSHIDKILREQNFGASGRVDATTAAKMGKLLGADAVIMGTITDFSMTSSGKMRVGRLGLGTSTARTALTGRVVDVETGEILASTSGEREETGISLSVSNFKGMSFSSSEFRKSSLGKSVQGAVDEFCENAVQALSQASVAIASREARVTQTTGSVVALVGPNVIANIGAEAGVRKGQTYEVFRLTEVPGLAEPVRIPVGVIRITSVDPMAAVAEVDQCSVPVEIGDAIALE